MKIRLEDGGFILIGVAIGIILALQIQASPVKIGSFPLEQLEVKSQLLNTFSHEQELLKEELVVLKGKEAEATKIIEQRSSPKTLELLTRLRDKTGFAQRVGAGIRITLKDNPAVSRMDFSNRNENFVQASDLRDLVNALYLQDATAISINGNRIGALTPIRSLFDTIFIGNIQITSPFIIDVIGAPDSLSAAIEGARTRGITLFVDAIKSLTIPASTQSRSLMYTTIAVN